MARKIKKMLDILDMIDLFYANKHLYEKVKKYQDNKAKGVYNKNNG